MYIQLKQKNKLSSTDPFEHLGTDFLNTKALFVRVL